MNKNVLRFRAKAVEPTDPMNLKISSNSILDETCVVDISVDEVTAHIQEIVTEQIALNEE